MSLLPYSVKTRALITTDTAPAKSEPEGRCGPIGRRFVGQICLVDTIITIILSGFFFTNGNQHTLLDLREGGRRIGDGVAPIAAE